MRKIKVSFIIEDTLIDESLKEIILKAISSITSESEQATLTLEEITDAQC